MRRVGCTTVKPPLSTTTYIVSSDEQNLLHALVELDCGELCSLIPLLCQLRIGLLDLLSLHVAAPVIRAPGSIRVNGEMVNCHFRRGSYPELPLGAINEWVRDTARFNETSNQGSESEAAAAHEKQIRAPDAAESGRGHVRGGGGELDGQDIGADNQEQHDTS